HARTAADCIGLFFVVVPGLDNARIAGGDVDLAERRKVRLVAAEDLHQPAALVRDHPKRLRQYSVDHSTTCEESPSTKRWAEGRSLPFSIETPFPIRLSTIRPAFVISVDSITIESSISV